MLQLQVGGVNTHLGSHENAIVTEDSAETTTRGRRSLFPGTKEIIALQGGVDPDDGLFGGGFLCGCRQDESSGEQNGKVQCLEC